MVSVCVAGGWVVSNNFLMLGERVPFTYNFFDITLHFVPILYAKILFITDALHKTHLKKV